ncbi:CDP-6-deoxy-L-threo-D-glycero-4-hexulose-3-dehydrase reductase [Pigmentiphaga humi]|uniref:CDP-6-deoxy-L-threo-D-glycero-4-hexulose-3-dehydrase reductase n=1 Tax=Pigmentiphaga humi TaxID=2478468 RepID=A0A3P4B417_9BURK|nr:CDP-6-deoxy-delta-3,4-glucoseen reductase [Pigmentiphaga humi]VCU71044.1 CDP-6-deoxy-L-threo-D-glycero-4-hexulose-3-dehydrase reductase [Pigmentiphaga humi]
MRLTITLEPSGHSFQAEPGQPLLAAGLSQGIALPHSCKTGICRTCRARVLAGQVDPGPVAEEYLSPEERERGVALLCRATAQSDCIIEVAEAPRSFDPVTLPARIASLSRPAPDVAVARLRLPMNKKLMLLPGQFIEILLGDGQRRSYSVANAPGPQGTGEIELHIRRVPNGSFTTQVFETLKAQDMVRFEGPFGSFYLRESDRPIIMLASGTGFAPIQAIIQSLLQRQEQGSGDLPSIRIYWGGRRRADLYAADRAENWAGLHPRIQFVPVLSEPAADCSWTGRTGLVHEAVMADHPELAGFDVYACGAPIMVDAARRDFTRRCGLPESQFYADSFFTTAEKSGIPS